MKKAFMVMTGLMIMMGLGIVNASAQTWTWQDPVLISTTVVEIAGDPNSDAIYGIDQDGEIFPILDVQQVAGDVAPTGALTPVRDFVFSSQGILYAIADGAVMRVDLTSPPNSIPLDPQPKVPVDDAKGSYAHITPGVGGKLYVLFQAESGRQYLLIGFPPVLQGLLTADIKPETLNIKSKGNWVSCHLALASGYAAADIDLASVKITRLEIAGLTPIDYEIFRAPGSPWNAFGNKLILKFINYDKENPANPQSLNWQLSTLLDASPKGKYDVTATVMLQMKEGPHAGEWLSGTATFHALKPTKK